MTRISMMEIAATAGLEKNIDYGMDVNEWRFWIQETPDVLDRFQKAQEAIMSKI